MTRLIAAAALAALAAGCGGSTPQSLDYGGADATAVAQLVEELNEAVGNPKKFTASFAKGGAPADVKKYTAFAYYLVGKPTVSGTEATAKVSVRRQKDEVEAGQVEWQFVKEGDTWKIKSAPLSGGK